MSIYRKDEIAAADSENGIWLDYRGHTFLFFLKDDFWTKEECRAARKNVLTVSFVQKGILDLFLAEIDDCFECSDLPFFMKEADDSLKQSLQEEENYGYEVVLVQKDGTVAAVRDGTFTPEHSRLLKERLALRLAEDTDAEDFEKAYEKNAARMEPYEFEKYALFTERVKH